MSGGGGGQLVLRSPLSLYRHLLRRLAKSLPSNAFGYYKHRIRQASGAVRLFRLSLFLALVYGTYTHPASFRACTVDCGGLYCSGCLCFWL